MSDKAWGDRLGLGTKPDGETGNADDTYKPWVTGAAGFARDLKIVPAQDTDELTRFIPYMQSISLELNKAATQLGMMCHTSGQIIFIEGHGLGELAEQISAKRVNSVHVWSTADGPKPSAVVTAVRFDKSISDFIAVKE